MHDFRVCLSILAMSITGLCDQADTGCMFSVRETEFHYGADVLDWPSYWASVRERDKQAIPETTEPSDPVCSGFQMGRYIGGVGSPHTGFQKGLSDKQLQICMNGVRYLNEILNSTVYLKTSFLPVCDHIETIDDDTSVSHWSIDEAGAMHTGLPFHILLVHKNCQVVRPRVVVRKLHVVAVDDARNVILSLTIPLESPSVSDATPTFAAIDRERALELTRTYVAEHPVLKGALDYEAWLRPVFFHAGDAPYWIVWFPPKDWDVIDDADIPHRNKVIWGPIHLDSAAWGPEGDILFLPEFNDHQSEIELLPILIRPDGTVDPGAILPRATVGGHSCHQGGDNPGRVVQGWVPSLDASR